MAAPLADRLRPTRLEDVVGQKHLLGENKALRRIIESGEIPNLIFYGPSGVGKTTVAEIIASGCGKRLHRLNATTASISDIKDMIAELGSFAARDGILPVSYTHLDVYKRQDRYLPLAYERPATLFDYTENALLFVSESAKIRDQMCIRDTACTGPTPAATM